MLIMMCMRGNFEKARSRMVLKSLWIVGLLLEFGGINGGVGELGRYLVLILP